MTLPPILNADQAAELLHLASGREVLKLARQRRLPHTKLGRRVLFVRDQLVEFLACQAEEAVSDAKLH